MDIGDLTSSSSAGQQSQQGVPSELIDFSFYTKMMLSHPHAPAKQYKSELIQIKALRGSHLEQNKLSDKMGRRDIQFYDLYRLNEPQQAVNELKKEGFSWTENVYDQQQYEDIEVQDFN
jgi:hypothetical protein